MAARKRKLSEARLSKLVRNMKREPPSWEGPLEIDLVLTDLSAQLRRKRIRAAAPAAAKDEGA